MRAEDGNRQLGCDTCEEVALQLQGLFCTDLKDMCSLEGTQRRKNMYMWHTGQ